MNRAPGPHPEAAPQPEQFTEDTEVLAIEVEEQHLALDGTQQATKTIRARMTERAANRLEHRRVFNEQLADNMVAKLEGSEPAEDLAPQNWLERRAERKAHKKLQEVKDAKMRMRVEDAVHGGKGMGRVKYIESRQSKKDLRGDIHKKRREGSMSAEESYKELKGVKYNGRVYKDSRAQRKARDEVRETKLELVKYAAQPLRSKARAGLETRLRQSAEKPAKQRKERHTADLENPGYYFDSANILSLKRIMRAEADKQYGLAIAEAIGKGKDESTVSLGEIETKANLESVARYFGFKSWREAEKHVPGWLIDGVTQMLGMSEAELEAEAEREQRPITRSRSQQPLELSHDESIHLRDEEEGIDSFQMEDGPEVPEAEPVEQPASRNQLEEIINPERDPYAGYEQKIRTMAQRIDAAIEEQTAGITNPNEKRNIVDAVYKEAIADFFGMSEEDLANDTGVPKELLNQVVSDIKTARREIDQNETEAAKRIAYNVAQRVSFRLAEETRGKSLTEKEREDLKFNLFLETLASELSVTPEDLDNPKLVSQRLKKKALARIDQNEKERLERVAKMDAEEAAKTPEQRRADADNEQLDKLRNIIND